ncbi:hypothetical protein R1flu_022960 [Riccia fluitans]|uniref:serine O-acetyltransferase n=1 Tax=Riccia fluitans TaxID=41844 RepID=A0ABD1XRD7_9MARC
MTGIFPGPQNIRHVSDQTHRRAKVSEPNQGETQSVRINSVLIFRHNYQRTRWNSVPLRFNREKEREGDSRRDDWQIGNEVSSGSFPRSISTSQFSIRKAWGKKKTRTSRSADITVPSSVLMEERTASNDHALTIIRENFRSAFEHSLSDAAAGGAMEAPIPTSRVPAFHEDDPIWREMRSECRSDSEQEPALASYLYSTILAHKSLERALAFHLGNKLSSVTFLSTQLVTLINETIMEDVSIRQAIRADIMAVRTKDPACVSYSHCLLNFKGFLALQAHRVAHRLWMTGRQSLALAIQSRVSEVFHVDIHPAARIGCGILFDHATGVVVGETAVIGNNVSVLHHVTLGGTGAVGGDRHPKIGDGVLIGAGATILGPIRVGEGAKIGAGSVVLNDVPPHTTAVGNPARLVGGKAKPAELKDIPSDTMDHTSFIMDWSDYVI